MYPLISADVESFLASLGSPVLLGDRSTHPNSIMDVTESASTSGHGAVAVHEIEDPALDFPFSLPGQYAAAVKFGKSLNFLNSSSDIPVVVLSAYHQ
jgi:hypothetical protein